MVREVYNVEMALERLRALSMPENRSGMARFGISIDRALGVSMPNIRAVGKGIVKDHDLAQQLWESEIHEARILASIIDHPKWVTEDQMDEWVLDFNSWDLCDQVCGNLFDKTPFVDVKIREWAERDEEFVKRAAFALIAWRAVHDKKCGDRDFLPYFTIIENASDDNRNFVKKAVNWALRQIGKRSAELHMPALNLAERLRNSENPAKRWIGKDAEKELNSEKMRKRLGIE